MNEEGVEGEGCNAEGKEAGDEDWVRGVREKRGGMIRKRQ